MKAFQFCLPLFAALFTTCSGDQQDRHNPPTATQHQPAPDTVIETETVEPGPAIDPVTLEEIPQEWTQLTKDPETNKLVIFHYCEAEDPQILIEARKGEGWQMTVLHGQDAEIWNIVSFEGTRLEEGGEVTVFATFELEPEMTYDQEVKTVYMTWYPTLHYAGFENLYGSITRYVAAQDKEFYDEVDENCEGLWE